MSVVRSPIEDRLHRLANRVECELSDLFQELLAESRVEAVSTLAWNGCRFIQIVREVRDGKEGDA